MTPRRLYGWSFPPCRHLRQGWRAGERNPDELRRLRSDRIGRRLHRPGSRACCDLRFRGTAAENADARGPGGHDRVRQESVQDQESSADAIGLASGVRLHVTEAARSLSIASPHSSSQNLCRGRSSLSSRSWSPCRLRSRSVTTGVRKHAKEDAVVRRLCKRVALDCYLVNPHLLPFDCGGRGGREGLSPERPPA